VSRRHWEDFSPGQVEEFGPRTITREEIVEFAAEFDPQPFHLDEEAARQSMLGGLCASGWHSCCILMKMISDGFLYRTAFLGAPGIEEVRWLAPVRPGTALTARASVVETRPSRSRPDIGFVKFRFELVDPGKTPLMTLVVSPMIGRREMSQAQAAPQSAPMRP
jgi:acyl dehydratase